VFCIIDKNTQKLTKLDKLVDIIVSLMHYSNTDPIGLEIRLASSYSNVMTA